jgi:hypothetical protein
MCRPTRRGFRGRLIRLGEMSEEGPQPLHRGSGGSTYTRKAHATREAPNVVRDDQPDAREGQVGRSGVAERFVVPLKPGNAGGGKGPQFKTNARRGEGPGDWATYQLRIVFRNCRRRCTRKRRQKPVSLLRPVRQDQPRRYSGACLCPVPLQQGRTGCGRSGLRRYRGVWGASDGLANWRLRSGRRPTDRTHQTSVHTEGQRQTQAAGHLDRAGSGLHDSSDAGAGTDL